MSDVVEEMEECFYALHRQADVVQRATETMQLLRDENEKLKADLEMVDSDLQLAVKRLTAENERLTKKAIQFDLDQAGIESRAREAAELVDLRAEVTRLKDERMQLAVVVQRAYRKVAEDQREACAAWLTELATSHDEGEARVMRDVIRATPLVTEKEDT